MKKFLITAVACFMLFTSTNVMAAKDGWNSNGKNWSYYKSGKAVKSNWVYTGGNWYYFDSQGNMVTGWKKIDNDWFSFTKDGQMRTGWYKDGEMWYSLKQSGQMRTGWFKEKDTWYFLRDSGAMITNWFKTYKNSQSYWSFFNEDGSMRYQELAPASDKNLYAIDKDGYMVEKSDSNKFTARNGKSYYIKSNKGNGFVAITNEWYFEPDYNNTSGITGKISQYTLQLYDNVEANTEISVEKVIQNIRKYPNKKLLGEDGQVVNNPPEVNVVANIEINNGIPVVKNPSVTMNYSRFAIINNKLVVYNQEEINGNKTLVTGYNAFIGTGAEAGYNLLVYANEKGEITKMKRLDKDTASLLNKKIDGLNNDSIIINSQDGKVTIVGHR